MTVNMYISALNTFILNIDEIIKNAKKVELFNHISEVVSML